MSSILPTVWQRILLPLQVGAGWERYNRQNLQGSSNFAPRHRTAAAFLRIKDMPSESHGLLGIMFDQEVLGTFTKSQTTLGRT